MLPATSPIRAQGNYSLVSFEIRPLIGDFDLDDELTVADMDALSAAVRDFSTDPLFDLNDDGIADQEDRRIWIDDRFGTFFGDASLDKEVDFVDFTSLAFFFDKPGGWEQGDFDGSGAIQFSDFLLLSSNFGKLTPAVTAVPEPTTALLLVIGLVGLVPRRSIVSKTCGA